MKALKALEEMTKSELILENGGKDKVNHDYKQLIIDMVESMKDSESLELIYTCAKVLYDYENEQGEEK